MSNGINQRQNEENSIQMLGAQRQIYNEAKILKMYVFVISVLVPLALATAQIFVKTNPILNTCAYIASIISMFVGVFFDKYIEKKKEVASSIQLKFDTYVYRMSWDNRLFGEKRNLCLEEIGKSRKLFKKRGEKEKLYNWYTRNVDEYPLEKGILFCQKENVYWDMGLRRRYRIVCNAFILSMIIFILGIGVAQNESIQLLVYRMAFIAPLIYWLYDKVKTLNADIRKLNRLYGEIAGEDIKTMDDLQVIQRDIIDHRKSCCFIPNWFYSKFKNDDEITFMIASRMDNL